MFENDIKQKLEQLFQISFGYLGLQTEVGCKDEEKMFCSSSFLEIFQQKCFVYSQSLPKITAE